eukprot:COSAG06_NODE_858_length_11909_cov_6.018036_13_plen_172_part_00
MQASTRSFRWMICSSQSVTKAVSFFSAFNVYKNDHFTYQDRLGTNLSGKHTTKEHRMFAGGATPGVAAPPPPPPPAADPADAAATEFDIIIGAETAHLLRCQFILDFKFICMDLKTIIVPRHSKKRWCVFDAGRKNLHISAVDDSPGAERSGDVHAQGKKARLFAPFVLYK